MVESNNEAPRHVQKPPIGLRPRWFVQQERVAEILAACARYNAVNKEIPKAWLEELSELENSNKTSDAIGRLDSM